MQIFYDFISYHRNQPPPAVRILPEWAKPSILHGGYINKLIEEEELDIYPFSRTSSFDSSEQIERLSTSRSRTNTNTWQDIDSMDSEDIRIENTTPTNEQMINSASNQFRNEILQAEGNLNALWNCVKTYMRATNVWWSTTSAVVDEFKRVTDIPLYKASRGQLNSEDDKYVASLPTIARLVDIHNKLSEMMQGSFVEKCEEQVLKPLDGLLHEVLPEVKHSYWTRLANMPTDASTIDTENSGMHRRLHQEREVLLVVKLNLIYLLFDFDFVNDFL
jgi:hypothetical protein